MVLWKNFKYKYTFQQQEFSYLEKATICNSLNKYAFLKFPDFTYSQKMTTIISYSDTIHYSPDYNCSYQ